MVGYNKNDSMSQKEKLLAGCMSGVLTRFITQPMDVIKLRKQLIRNPKKTISMIARRIFWEEGVTAFWHGHCLGQMHSILAVSCQFYVYELATKFAETSFDTPPELQHMEHFACGLVAGCACTALVIPLEVIRVRQMMVKDQYRSIVGGARAVYRYGGIAAFYEGLTASLIQMGPQVGISFAVFNLVQPFLLGFLPQCAPGECVKGNTHKPGSIVVASSIAGSTAGFVAKSVTYPFDLVKRRLQVGSHKSSAKYQTPTHSQNIIKCTRLLDCLIKAYKKEGIRGLFRGWAVTIYKAQLTSIVAFTSYELICYATREINELV